MGRVLGLLIGLAWHVCLCADDDDLFSDFDDIPMEVDRDFIDDFDDIEAFTANIDSSSAIITDSYEMFSARDIVRREKSLSILGGNETIASAYYFTLFPQGKFEVWKIYGHLGLPLRFPVYDDVSPGSHGIRRRGFFDGKSFVTPRPRDFKSFWDGQKAIRHFAMGDSSHFMRLSRSHAITLGLGELVRAMSPEGLYDADTLFLSGYTQWEQFRISGFLAPMFKAEMLGLSVRFTPFTAATTNAFVSNLNFDVSYAADFIAPHDAHTSGRAYVLTDDQRAIKRSHGTAQGAALGVANEFSILSWLALKPYLSSGHLWLTGVNGNQSTYGSGLHVGHDASVFFIPNTRRSTLTFKTEGRLFSSRYFPSYFGSTYLIDRLSFYAPNQTADAEAPLTKSQFLAGQTDRDFRFGYLFELNYAFDNLVAAALGYENAHSFVQGRTITPMRKLYLITSFLGLDVVKIHAGFEAINLAQMKELFDFEKSRALLSVRGQLKILPFLYFDSWVKHSFGINDMFTAESGEEGEALWLSNRPETRSLNFGLGLELAMTF